MASIRFVSAVSVIAFIMIGCPDSGTTERVDGGRADAAPLEPDASLPDAAADASRPGPDAAADASLPDAAADASLPDAGPQTCIMSEECPDGELCFDGICAEDACTDVECPNPQVCYAGACYEPCIVDGDCTSPNLCYADRCTDDPCADVLCASGQACVSGTCFAVCAQDDDCAFPDVCWDERCAEDPCSDIQCATIQICFDGECLPRCGPGELGCADLGTCADAPCLAGTVCTDGLGSGDYTCSTCMMDCPDLRALAGPDVDYLAGTNVLLNGGALGTNGGFICEWTNDIDTTVVNDCVRSLVPPAAEVEYTLTVTDASGAVATDSFVAAEIPFLADAGPAVNIELGQTATLTATWQAASCRDGHCIACDWSLSDGTSIATTCSATVSPAATTQYFLELTDGGSLNVATDDTTVYVTDQPAQLCGWDVVVMTSNIYPTGGNPDYICDANNTARRQLVNGKPAIVLSDLDVQNVRIRGEIGVSTASDDDLIGLLWGWRNPKQAYLLSWKQGNQAFGSCGNALAGIAVKKLDGARSAPDTITFNPSFGFNATDYVYNCSDMWATDRNSGSLLKDDTIFLLSPRDSGASTGGWRDNVIYRIDLYYTATKTKVFVEEAPVMSGVPGTPVTSFTIEDSSYPSGAFAFFSNSQERVDFGDFILASLDGYRADAGPDQTIASGESATLSGTAELGVPPIACAWSDTSTVVATDCEATLMPASTMTYTLTVTDDFGNVATDDVEIDVAP